MIGGGRGPRPAKRHPHHIKPVQAESRERRTRHCPLADALGSAREMTDV